MASSLPPEAFDQSLTLSFCEHMIYTARIVYSEIDPIGLVTAVGNVVFPCRVPLMPLTPDVVKLVYEEVLPRCIIDVIGECIQDMDGRVQPEDLWIVSDSLSGFSSLEEAVRYWDGMPTHPTIVIKGSFREAGGKPVFYLIPIPIMIPGAELQSGGMIVMRPDAFMKLHGPSGVAHPNLLNHYKRYRIIRVEGGLDLEEVDKPYYED